jgi:hypothetical protein
MFDMKGSRDPLGQVRIRNLVGRHPSVSRATMALVALAFLCRYDPRGRSFSTEAGNGHGGPPTDGDAFAEPLPGLR